VDAELIRLTRLRSAHAEEQYRIRSNLRRSHEDAEIFTTRLANLRQDLVVRLDTSGDKFRIELDGQESNNRGIAGELIMRRAEKLKARFGDDIRIGRFAGFDLFLRPGFNNTTEMVLRGKNSYGARVAHVGNHEHRRASSAIPDSRQPARGRPRGSHLRFPVQRGPRFGKSQRFVTGFSIYRYNDRIAARSTKQKTLAARPNFGCFQRKWSVAGN